LNALIIPSYIISVLAVYCTSHRACGFGMLFGARIKIWLAADTGFWDKADWRPDP
jgi:hypothetical protein